MGQVYVIKCPYCGSIAEVNGVCIVYICDDCEETYETVGNTEDSYYPYEKQGR